MKKAFDHPVCVVDYAVEFRTLVAESDLNDASLQGVFLHGLSEGVKDELAVHDNPDSPDGLVVITIKLDNE